ncbi:MAG: NTP transferase domain-containing protein, partial [Gemmatimonadales bacterium]|nr:NTP transferase domain-containing protein [Gemmatimonadales bacterium]
MNRSLPQVTAVVLAGQRPTGDPLARHFGKPYKALVEVGGRSMLSRVVETLLSAPSVGSVVVLCQEPDRLL